MKCSKVGKFIVRKYINYFQGLGGKLGVTAKRCGISFGVDGNGPELDIGAGGYTAQHIKITLKC